MNAVHSFGRLATAVLAALLDLLEQFITSAAGHVVAWGHGNVTVPVNAKSGKDGVRP